MSTFLEICKQIGREIGKPGTGPTTVVSQTGEYGDIVRWASRSYLEIQNRHGGRWNWLRQEFTLPVTALWDTYTYAKATDVRDAAAISRFKGWILDDTLNPPKIYPGPSSIGNEHWLSWTTWEWFRSIYRIGTQTASTPAHVSETPQQEIVLGPKPNAKLRFNTGTAAFVVGETVTGGTSAATGLISAVTLESGSWVGGDAAGYLTLDTDTGVTGGPFVIETITSLSGSATSEATFTVSGEYFKGPQILAADTDVPEMPSDFHDLIVYYAIEKYGYLEAATEVLARAEKYSRTYMRQLENHQLARMRMRGPLV